MRTNSESRFFTNISATTAAFTLAGDGFYYALCAHAADWNAGGSITLHMQTPDGSFVPTGMALLADGLSQTLIAAGVYKLVVAGGATGIYASLCNMPGS